MLKNIVILSLVIILSILSINYYQLKDSTRESMKQEYKYLNMNQPKPLIILKNICKEINERGIDYDFKILGKENIIDKDHRLLETFHNIYSLIVSNGLQLSSFGQDSLRLKKDVNSNCSNQYAKYLVSKYYYNSITYAYLLRYYIKFNDYQKTKKIYYKLRKSFAFIKATNKFPLNKHTVLYKYINEALEVAQKKYTNL